MNDATALGGRTDLIAGVLSMHCAYRSAGRRSRSGTFPGRFRHVMETLLRGGVASTLVTPFSSFVTPSARNIHSVTSFGEDS